MIRLLWRLLTMSMKWWTESSSRKSSFRKGFIITLLCITLTISGCSLLPEEQLEEQLPTITPPTIAQKPEYPVKTETIEIKVRGVGKIMSLQEEELFFTSDGARIRNIFVQNGEQVSAGQLLAELDTTELENQIRSEKLRMRTRE